MFTPVDGSVPKRGVPVLLPANAFQLHVSPKKSLIRGEGSIWRCVVTQAELVSMMESADEMELTYNNKVVTNRPSSMEAEISTWNRKTGDPAERGCGFLVGQRLRVHFFEANHPCEDIITRVGFATTLMPQFSEAGRKKMSTKELHIIAYNFRMGHAHSNVNHRVWTCHKH